MVTKLDKVMAYGIGHHVTFFDHVITCSVMTKKKHNIINSTSAMDTKIDRVVVYDMGPRLKEW